MNAVEALQKVYFLEHLTPEEFQALAEMMDLRPFVSGDKILSQAEPTTNFYILDSGFVNLRYTEPNGLERPIGSKGPGEFFGVKMFTTQEESQYTFEAVGQANMWVVERRDWDELLAQFPNILDHMPELSAEYNRLTQGLNWLAPGEIIDISTRRHPWALLLMMRWPLLTMFVLTLAVTGSTRFLFPNTASCALPVYGIAMLGCVLWAAWEAINWWNDSYIVTNKRAVRINKVLFFSDSTEEIAIDKIQSQNVTRGGPISVLLNIADLQLTSAASSSGGVTFLQVGNVEHIQHLIDGERAKVVERRGAAERERLRAQIAGQMRHYVFQQPNPPEKPAGPPPPPPMGDRWKILLTDLFGTEMRDGKNVTWRKSRIVLLRQVVFGLLFFFLFLALCGVVSTSGSILQSARNGVTLGLGVLVIASVGLIIWQWLDWRVDLYQLTESQIIDIESLPFGLRYSESKADLSKIQDVNTARPHFYNTMFDYGNVVARVAGNAEPFTFDKVKHPRKVADEITERMFILKTRENERNTRDQTRTIVDAIIAYHRLMMAERLQNQPPPAAPTVIVSQAAPITAAPPPSELPAANETAAPSQADDWDDDTDE